MSHASIAAIIIGVTVASVLYFVFGSGKTQQSHSHQYYNYDSYSDRQSFTSEDYEECSICLFPMRCNNIYTLHGCKHTFHKKCIEKWKDQTCQSHTLCPLCKNPFILDYKR